MTFVLLKKAPGSQICQGLLGKSLMVNSLKCHVCGFALGTAEEEAGEGILSPGQLKVKHTPND